MILRGDLNFFGQEQGGMSRFFITGRGGGCQFFSLILVYNEKATVIVFFF